MVGDEDDGEQGVETTCDAVMGRRGKVIYPCTLEAMSVCDIDEIWHIEWHRFLCISITKHSLTPDWLINGSGHGKATAVTAFAIV